MDPIDAILVDDDGVPYSAERFQHEPQAAHSFLELLESNSLFVVANWRELPEDFVVMEASRHLHLIQQDLMTADWLRQKDKLH